jgi:RHS repeat-associated protein
MRTSLGGAPQIFAYDAYGLPIGFDAAAVLTTILYSGEQFTPSLNQYYLRARYYDLATGRFNRVDPFFGNLRDPQSFHKYLYTHADPVNATDPTGRETLTSLMVGTTIQAIGVAAVAGAVIAEYSYFVHTPAEEWSVTGALASIGTGAALGAFGATTIGAATFIFMGFYSAIQVWRDPNATPTEKVLASVDVLIGLLTP